MHEKHSHRKEESAQDKDRLIKRRLSGRLLLLLLVLGTLAAAALWLFQGQHIRAQANAPGAAQESGPTSLADFKRLLGRWQRPDGGYVLDIKEINAQGNMTAAYYNPRPINVSHAEAALDGSTLKLFIELRDVNYPGATYHLTYDPEKDQLQGVYFQPVLQQKFDVFFIRMK